MRWLGQALQGDLGRSFITGEPVMAALARSSPSVDRVDGAFASAVAFACSSCGHACCVPGRTIYRQAGQTFVRCNGCSEGRAMWLKSDLGGNSSSLNTARGWSRLTMPAPVAEHSRDPRCYQPKHEARRRKQRCGKRGKPRSNKTRTSANHSSKRSRPSARQRFMPRPRGTTPRCAPRCRRESADRPVGGPIIAQTKSRLTISPHVHRFVAEILSAVLQCNHCAVFRRSMKSRRKLASKHLANADIHC